MTDDNKGAMSLDQMRHATREMIGANPEGARQEMATMVAEIRELRAALASRPAVVSADAVPSEVLAWRDAYKAYVDAVHAYNNRLTVVRQRREEFSEFGSVDPEYQAMNDAKKEAMRRLPTMFKSLSVISPADQSGEKDTPNFNPCEDGDQATITQMKLVILHRDAQVAAQAPIHAAIREVVEATFEQRNVSAETVGNAVRALGSTTPSATPLDFTEWFNCAWASFPDKWTVEKIPAMTWALKAYKQFSAAPSAIPAGDLDAVETQARGFMREFESRTGLPLPPDSRDGVAKFFKDYAKRVLISSHQGAEWDRVLAGKAITPEWKAAANIAFAGDAVHAATDADLAAENASLRGNCARMGKDLKDAQKRIKRLTRERDAAIAKATPDAAGENHD